MEHEQTSLPGTSRLGQWLAHQLRERGWSQRDAEGHTGISRSTISLIVRSPQGSQHDWETLVELAEAFTTPLWQILEMAGIDLQLPEVTNPILRRLQSQAEHKPAYQQLLHLLDEMAPGDVQAVLSLLIGARQMRAMEAGEATARTTHHQ